MPIRKGPLLMIGATLVFTIMSGSVKVARAEMTTLDLIFWRGVVAIPLAYLMARKGGLIINKRGMFAIRLGLGFAAMICFFTALKELPLADTNMITKIQPVLIALGAPMLLGKEERADPRLWVLLFVGLGGCVILMAPNISTGSVWGLWALAASVFSAGSHIALRGLKTDSSGAIVFWLQVGVCVLSAGAILMFQGAIKMPPVHLWWAIAAVGGLATTGQLMITWAYKLESASRVAAVRFIGPIWGILGDVIFFSGWPEPHVWLGGAIVVGAGLTVVLNPPVEKSQADKQ
ncbi:MAG: DMT family transporter [Myxococcota bacterium]